MRKKRFPKWVGVLWRPQMSQYNRLKREWDFIVLKGNGSLVCLAMRQILLLLWMRMRFLRIGSNEDASCRCVGEGCLRRLCHKSGSVEIWDVCVWFGRGDM